MNVLVVDDNDELRAIVVNLVRQRGHHVVACPSAEDAQQASRDLAFDIVLLDLGLPGMDGFTFCRWLRAQEGGSRSVIVSFTGDMEEEALLNILDAGADDFISKPVHMDLLNIRIAVAERHARDRSAGDRVRSKLAESERNRRDDEQLHFSRMRALLQHHADIITVIGLDGARKYISPSVETLLGFSPADLVGQNGLQLIHPDDRSAVLDAMTVVQANPDVHPLVRLRLQHADGSWRDFEAITTNLIDDPSVGGIAFNSRDVTEKYRALDAQRESEQRFLLSFEHAPIGMAIIDLDGTCLNANRALTEMSGYSHDQLVGRVLDDLRHPDESEFDPDVIEKMRTGDLAVASFERRYQDRAGSEIWVLVNLSLVHGREGNPLYYVAQLVNVSERKLAERALSESETRFRLFVQSALDCVISTDRKGTITEFNPAAESTFGYARNEVIGTPFSNLMCEEDRIAHLQAMRQYFRTGESALLNRRIEVSSIRSNGERFPAELAVSVVEIGDDIAFVSYLRDITERLKLQAEIERNELRYRSLVMNATEIISVIGPDFRRTYVSPGIQRVLGYAPEELVGKSDVVQVHPDDQAKSAKLFELLTLFPEETQREEIRMRHRNGDWRWFETTVMNRNEDPAVGGFIVNARDITDHKVAELELESALNVQTEANRRLIELDREKSDFISVVSHEFRTPLTSIQGFSELIQEHRLDETTTQEFAGLIYVEAQRLNRLINEMLDLDRLKSGHVTFEKTPLHLDDLLESSVRGFAALSPSHTFVTDWSSPLPTVKADRDKIAQVFANLLGNAVKYSPEGGTITAGAEDESKCLHIWFRDEGIGIPKEALDFIFERYARIENNVHRRIKGTGLGLAIVKQIVELHQGELWAESKVGLGSTFHLRLPY